MNEKDIVKRELGTLPAEYWQEVYEVATETWENGYDSALRELAWHAFDYIAWSSVDGVDVPSRDGNESLNCMEVCERYIDDVEVLRLIYSRLIANTTEYFRNKVCPEFWVQLKEEANV